MAKQKTDTKCNLCGYEWKRSVNTPKQCPRCKRYDYERKVDAS